MKRILLAVLGTASLLAILPAAASAEVPTPQDRKDALRFARAYWQDRGYDARSDAGCRRVTTRLGRADGNLFGVVLEAEPCTIYLNVNAGWDGDGNRAPWWNVCATVIHEYGHILGKGHSRNPESIMAAYSEWNVKSSWYPWFPDCRYEGDDEDGDGYPDW